jgi:DNA segregation ATPase FtsK/SpoIIIE, S-DNA-T family
VQLKTTLPDGDKKKFSDRDELYEAAIDIVVREGRGSVSLLQRSLGIGYGRAARLVDFMAEDGIVGPYNGSQAREILMTLEQWEQITGQGSSGGGSEEPAKPQRSGKILMSPGAVRTVKPVDDEEDGAYDGDYDHEEEEEEEPPFDEGEPEEEDEADDEDYEEEEDADDSDDEGGEEEESGETKEREEADEPLDEEPADETRRPSKRPSTRRWKAESA